jgi:AraC-like DNA-binding protein
MSYQEFLPHPELRSCIDAYWTVCIDGHVHDLPVTDRILPDGCVDIILNQGTAVPVVSNHIILQPGQVYLIGTMTRFSLTLLHQGARLLGIRFKPGCFNAFYHLSLQSLTDRIQLFDPAFSIDHDAFTGSDFVQALDRCLMQKITGVEHMLLPVIADIYDLKGQVSVDRLARKHFMENRRLERSFKQHTGLTPKAFANLVRYRFALQRIKQRRESSLLEIAFDAGYYDHAHLANEIRKYTGLPPSQC